MLIYDAILQTYVNQLKSQEHALIMMIQSFP